MTNDARSSEVLGAFCDALASFEDHDVDADAIEYVTAMSIAQIDPIHEIMPWTMARVDALSRRWGLRGGAVPNAKFVAALGRVDPAEVRRCAGEKYARRGLRAPACVRDGTMPVLGVGT